MSTNVKSSCGISSSGIPEISPADVEEQKGKFTLIDVRRPDEWVGELGHIEGAEFATLETEFETALQNFPKGQTYVFVCRSGARSGRATEAALALGIKNVFNMKGGMIAWNESHLPIVRKGRS